MRNNPSFMIRNSATFGGFSPTDLFVQEAKVTLAGSAGTVSTDIAPGTIVYYALFKQGTIDASGNLAVSAPVPGATDAVEVIILTPAHTTQGAIPD